MKKITAKFTQLPNFEHEYLEIINRFKEGINESTIEDLISEIKGSILRNRYKHRTHLENLGFFIKDKEGKIALAEPIQQVKERKITLRQGLLQLVVENQYLIDLFQQIDSFNYFTKSCSLKNLASRLHEMYYPDSPSSTIERYLGQILKLFKIIGSDQIRQALKEIDKNEDYCYFIEKISDYFISFPNYSQNALPIENINKFLIDAGFDSNSIKSYWDSLYYDVDLKYKFTFVTLPNWSTKYKGITIGKRIFTHLIKEVDQKG